ncbi:MAG: beta-hydroxyacyl-ACP dehydratase [Planctomycetaceae bacterium]|nr:beta-hydroxyacyl-ACP dehydratase [Planctomycetaceae bacterium]
MSRQQILDAIPHRPPMLLVDEVSEWEPEHIVCRKTFQPDEWFFQGHYPDYPLVPGVILCEAAMQAGAVLLSKHVASDGVPVVGRLNDVKFKRMVRPGDTIQLDVTLDERMGDAFFLSAKVLASGKPAVTLSFVVTVAKREA